MARLKRKEQDERKKEGRGAEEKDSISFMALA